MILFLFQLDPSEVSLGGSIEEKIKTVSDDMVSSSLSSWSRFIFTKSSSPSWRHDVDDLLNLTTTKEDGIRMADDDEFMNYLSKKPLEEQQSLNTRYNESELVGGEKGYKTTLSQASPTNADAAKKNAFRAPMKSSKFINNKAVVFHLQEAWLESFALNETEILNEQREPLMEDESVLANATITMNISSKSTKKNEIGKNEMPGIVGKMVDAERTDTNLTESVPATTTIRTRHLHNNGTLSSNGTSTATRFLRGHESQNTGIRG
jgi:hypothetical protein